MFLSSSAQGHESVNRWAQNAIANKSLPNPNPSNYKIMYYVQEGDYLLIEIQYLDCTNYEGRKVMLYKTDIEKLRAQKVIDPHFSDNPKYISPIARFEPTREGWTNGLRFIDILTLLIQESQ